MFLESHFVSLTEPDHESVVSYKTTINVLNSTDLLINLHGYLSNGSPNSQFTKGEEAKVNFSYSVGGVPDSQLITTEMVDQGK